MSKINFEACGARIEYELADNATREELRIDGAVIVDCWGDVGAWGKDYHSAISGLHGCAKSSAVQKYLRERAEHLIIQEIFNLREMVKSLQS